MGRAGGGKILAQNAFTGVFFFSSISFPTKILLFAMLHNLRPASGSTQKRKRVARGSAAGGGTTAGRGGKGQHSRTGKGKRFGFEGGQMPLLRRQPKLGGFKRPRRVTFEPLNLDILEKRLEAGTYVLADLRAKRIVRTTNPVKLLGQGKVTKKFTIEVHAASKSAKKAIEQAGGGLKILPRNS